MLYSDPSDKIMFLQRETDLTAAVGPNVSVPLIGDCPSERAVSAGLPSGSAPVRSPNGVFEETVVVDA